ncbi:preprotein translocase subunit YajC [uncultured Ferrimonas sp.]|uniref:preprotein translocase subunit YajC n=1 Tax=uncultured Ferrimonas sp. TaxID=432640 RepID=UPI00261BF98E|nr:preprotein translocase subunit YajC [uncultured Ferrimonas sp.]
MFIANAYAADAGAPMGGFEPLFMLAIFGLVFYFMILRPQNKRVKEHKSLVETLSKGDEVLTTGGLVGKIAKVADDSDYVVLSLNDNNQVTLKKDFVTAVLPKGSIQSL